MSKVFKIGDSLIEFSGDIDAYNAIWKELLWIYKRYSGNR